MTNRNESGELSLAARAALEAGIESAKTEPTVYLGSFEQYANDSRQSRFERIAAYVFERHKAVIRALRDR